MNSTLCRNWDVPRQYAFGSYALWCFVDPCEPDWVIGGIYWNQFGSINHHYFGRN